MIHLLKIKEHFYDRIIKDEKTCEIRINDRDFQKGDLVMFDVMFKKHDDLCAKYVSDAKTFQWRITHVLQEYDGLEADFCMLSLKLKKS